MRLKAQGCAVLLAALAALWLAFPRPVDEATLAGVQSDAIAEMLLKTGAHHGPDSAALLRAARARQWYRGWQREQQAEDALHQDFSLHAVGSQLYTAWNQPVTLKAINWYGFEYAPFVPDGLDRAQLDSILASLHTLGFNALRIMFANETVESNPVVTAKLAANPGLRGLHALDIMQRIIERAHHFGLRVILCNSRSEAGRGPELQTGLWYTARYPESSWVADWETLVRRFRGESAFVGADLRNEPHIIGSQFTEEAYFIHGPLWGAYHGVYYHDRDWHYAAQTLGNDLLSINPHLLIIVEGVQMYLDSFRGVLTGGLWGSNLEGVQYDPIVLSRPGQLVYSVHEYGPHMWQGKWFNLHTTYASLAHRWDRLWGYLLSAQKALQAPIFVGEFGTCHDYWSCIASNQGWKQGFWFQSFVRYLHDHPQVGWAYWSLNPSGPFHPDQTNYYSLVSPSWRHYFPLVIRGLASLLAEPSGLWGSYAASTLPDLFTPQPGCSTDHSCTSPIQLAATDRPDRAAHPPTVTAVQIRRDVPYVGWSDSSRSGDLYLPEGSTVARPAVVIVHGGSWSQGQKGTSETSTLALDLARHGYVAYDINYRLADAGGYFPRDIRDVKAAAGFLAAHATQLHIDSGKIGIVGSGAGGYLAMMSAYSANNGLFAPRAGQTVIRIAAVGSFFAPADLEGIGAGGATPLAVRELAAYLHASYQQKPNLYRWASPKMHIAMAVPTIFFHGVADGDAPFAQIFRLYGYLKQHSVRADLHDLPGAPHSIAALPAPLRQQTMSQLIAFLDGVFYQPPISPGS
jgi:endoglucanase